jgi:hypothetical protein
VAVKEMIRKYEPVSGRNGRNLPDHGKASCVGIVLLFAAGFPRSCGGQRPGLQRLRGQHHERRAARLLLRGPRGRTVWRPEADTLSLPGAQLPPGGRGEAMVLQ